MIAVAPRSASLVSVPARKEPCRSFLFCSSSHFASPWFPQYVWGCWSLVLQSSCGGLIEYVTGEHDSGTPVTIAATSGKPVVAPALSTQFTASSTFGRNNAEVPTSARSCPHAVMTPLRASLALSFESMKSTTTFRPATPPPPAELLRYLAPALTPSTMPWKRPGTKGLSTSATT